ncbi:Uncharacterised protein [Serratia marcescens]|uniref:hypothetical protein n=1 Tax=Serratia marcescens TaxID=615 RepID=UPI000745225B|nr:hypothetical protein [Serratia marcescens]CUZ15578.1 Uncharacterised protein [Serratia marcescens]CVD94572.1 Uncharacterised protein [Serratia marcescens]
MAKLNKKERAWLDELQEVLNRCPSTRLGFFTIGDKDVFVYDKRLDKQIDEIQDRGCRDFGLVVNDLDAGFGELTFPAAVHSTAG